MLSEEKSVNNCKGWMFKSSYISSCKVVIDQRQKVTKRNLHPPSRKFSKFCCNFFGWSVERWSIKEPSVGVEWIILASILFTEWDRGDDFKTRTGSSLSVIWRDDDVDAGWVIRLLAAGNSSFIKGQGEIVIDKLREDGEELVGDIWWPKVQNRIEKSWWHIG